MKARMFLALAGTVLFFPLAFAQAAKRPQWDQKKARSAVEKITQLEQTQRRPWDNIAWLTDVDAAVARARKENKPILLYFFVKKGGPSTAPC